MQVWVVSNYLTYWFDKLESRVLQCQMWAGMLGKHRATTTAQTARKLSLNFLSNSAEQQQNLNQNLAEEKTNFC